ncbi:MAG: putative HNHc nuclease [Alphaproteobacteria bacterium]
MQKTPKIRSKKHLKFIANLPCVICRKTDVQAAHVRSGNGAGMGLKSGDDCVVPLCVKHHTKQHSMNERTFWSYYGGIENATRLANALFNVTGNNIDALRLIAGFT